MNDALLELARTYRLHGLVDHWPEVHAEPWVSKLLDWETQSRNHRGFERRIKSAHLGQFKPLSEFDWAWPSRCDRDLIEDLFQLDFLEEAANIILIGPNGVGKTTIALNLAQAAVLRGYTVRHVTASALLAELSNLDSGQALRRRLRHYSRFELLSIDELGYLSYSEKHADLLFELTNLRYGKRSTMITTNRPFGEWGNLFTSAACVVSMIDRLIHKAEIVSIEGKSYRHHEAQERQAQKARARSTRSPKAKP